MPESPLHALVYQRLANAFGEAHRIVAKDKQWSLPKGHRACINILANGTSQSPIVWVFDPHDHTDGVSYTVVTEEQHIDPLIEAIRQRVARVGILM